MNEGEGEWRAREDAAGDAPSVHVRHHFDLGFGLGDLLLRGELGAAAEEEGHFGWVLGGCARGEGGAD